MTGLLSTKSMARLLRFVQKSKKADLAASTAVVFACITALALWGVANAYPASEPLERLLSRGLPQRLNEGQDHRCDNHCPAHESNVDVNGFHGRTAGVESLILILSS